MTDVLAGQLIWQHHPIAAASLPDSWTASAVGEVMRDIQSGFPSGRHQREAVGVPHLRPMNVNRLGRLDMGDVKYVDASDGHRLQQGDILFNNTNSPALVGKTAHIQIERDLAFSNHMTRLRPAPGVEPRYAAAYLHFLWSSGYFQHRCTNHVNQASISSSVLAGTVPFVLPPAAEQRRIVAALEEHLSDLDVAVAGLGRARANVERYRAAVLQASVSPGIADEHGWAVHPLGDLAHTSSGGTPNRARAEYFGRAIPWLKSGELNDGTVRASKEFITPAGLSNSSAKIFPRGTLCIALYGATVGRLGMLSIDASTNQAICGIQPDDRVEPWWLFYVLREGRQRLVDAGKGGAQSNISQGIVRAYPVPVPPRDEQRAIVADVERRLTIADRTAADLDAQLARAARLRQAVLRRAFEGRLVPQDPADEPAAALLARIQAERAAPGGRTSRRGTPEVRRAAP